MAKTFKLGRLVLTTTRQGPSAPFIDSCTTINRDIDTNKENWRAKGKAFLLKPWKRNRYGESEIQTALVIGWSNK